MTEKIIKTVVGALLITCLCSCETVLNSKEINQKYSKDNINDFVKHRYVSNYYTKLTEITGRKSLTQYTDQLLNDGKSVIYAAFFTGRNSKYLYKPRNEFQSFCDAKGGVFYIIKKYDFNFDGLKEDPTEKYWEALSKNLSVTININQTTSSVYSTSVSETPVTHAAALVANANAQAVNSSDLSQVYQEAIENDSFGLYRCVNINSSKVLWGVNIQPVAYKAQKSSGDLLDHTSALYLLITPISREE